ncbi:SEL1-like repeat protein [bacterium]|nr:SEL1-like repeat protein [bacterium]
MEKTVANGIALYNNDKFEEAYEILYPFGTFERNPEAQYYLGLMCYDGESVEKNIEQAAKWWTMARREGHRDAAYTLSEIKVSTKNLF